MKHKYDNWTHISAFYRSHLFTYIIFLHIHLLFNFHKWLWAKNLSTIWKVIIILTTKKITKLGKHTRILQRPFRQAFYTVGNLMTQIIIINLINRFANWLKPNYIAKHKKEVSKSKIKRKKTNQYTCAANSPEHEQHIQSNSSSHLLLRQPTLVDLDWMDRSICVCWDFRRWYRWRRWMERVLEFWRQ